MTAHPPAPVQAPASPTPVAPDAAPILRRPFVTAILVCRTNSAAVGSTLAALAAQTRRADRLVALDLSGGTQVAAVVRDKTGGSTALPEGQVFAARGIAEPGSGLGTLVNALVSDLSEVVDPANEWLWLVGDDSAPEPSALRQLVDAVRRSPSVGIAGPKVLDRTCPRLLLEVGQQVTRTGRLIAAPAPGEPDQGQFDTRTDVLAVGLPGMLIRRALFDRIGGFERAFAGPGEALDLGWRAQLAGERVVVVPGARLMHGVEPADPTATSQPTPAAALAPEPGGEPAGDPEAEPSASPEVVVPNLTSDPSTGSAPAASPGRTSVAQPVTVADSLAQRRAARSAARRVALARCSPWTVPLMSLWVLLSSVGSALVLLVLKRPAHAWVELGDLGALAHPLSAVGARWRFRRRRRLRRRDLSTLFVTSGEALRHTADRVQDALTPDRGEQERVGVAGQPAGESGPVAEEAEDLNIQTASVAERIVTNPGVLATTAAALVGALGFRASLRGGLFDAQGTGLAGGELSRVATDATGLWHAFRDSWHGAGWGTAADSGPYVGILAALTWMLERLPYVGDGRSPASVMLAWTLVLGMPLATVTAYLAGRVVTLARWPRALVALAWGTSGVVAASVSQGRVTLVLAGVLLPLVAGGLLRAARTDGTFTSAAATALGAGALGALVPPYLLAVAVVAIGLVVVGPSWGRRVRGLALLVLPPALQGAWLGQLLSPQSWLAVPGALDGSGAADPSWWAMLGGFPDGATVLRAGLAAPMLLAGVLALLRRPSSRGQAVAQTALVVVAVLGLGWGLLARRVVAGSVSAAGGLQDAVPWPGVGVQLYVLALLALALGGSVGMRGVVRGSRWAPRRLAAGSGLLVLAVAVLTAGGITGWSRLDRAVTVSLDARPAVAVEQAGGPEANRLLTLAVTESSVDYELVGREPGDVLRGPARVGDGTDPGVGPAVAALVSGQSGVGRSPALALADLGVGFVSVQGTPAPDVIRTLDATAGLTRLGSTDEQTLWRVLARPSMTTPGDIVPASRARITTAEGELSEWVRVDGAHGALTTTLGAGPSGRRLVLAEPREWITHAEVRFDGVLLEATDSGLPTYVLPARAGQLTVDVPPRHPRWLAAQLVLLAVVVFLAVPFGNRRSRRVR